MFSAYPACFFKEENGYSVIFPDLGYLATCGDDLDDSLRMAIDCLAGYLYTCRRDGTQPPPPSPINSVDMNAVAAELEIGSPEAFASLVTVDVDEYAKTHFERSVKKTLTIPEWLNNAALENGVNFSQVLQEALRIKLGYGS